MFAGIEVGGTKIIVAPGTGPDDLTAPVRLPTTRPDHDMPAVLEVLADLQDRNGPISGIGIATFGPVGLSPGDPRFGHILRTPKPGWTGADIVGPIRGAFPNLPIALDTDVNGAGLAERRWGEARGADDFAYVTMGTGVGVGVFTRGRPVHGRLHPEAGHVLVQRRPDDHFASLCPFHKDCFEGLASGPAIRARTGQAGEHLTEQDDIWSLVGDYLAQLCYALTLIASPRCIVIGGSVGLRPELLTHARPRLHALLGGYLEALEDSAGMQRYLRPAAAGTSAGVLGAIALASDMAFDPV